MGEERERESDRGIEKKRERERGEREKRVRTGQRGNSTRPYKARTL
jgi:hypothetical protein